VFVCAYTYVCIHVYLCVCVFVCIHIHTRIYIYTCIYIHTRIYTHERTHIQAHSDTAYVYGCVCDRENVCESERESAYTYHDIFIHLTNSTYSPRMHRPQRN